MIRALYLPSLLFLTACASSPSKHFPNAFWTVDSNESYFRDEASHALKVMKEPSFTEPNTHPEFRMLMLTGVTPIHAIRVTPKENGTALIKTTVLGAGYRVKGRRKLSKDKNRIASKADVITFLDMLEKKSLFRQNSMPSLELFHTCIHASYFIYEFKSQNEQDIIIENYCAHTSEGLDVMKAFYAIADIDLNEGWALTVTLED